MTLRMVVERKIYSALVEGKAISSSNFDAHMMG
jgi:hypothetical protein